MNKILIRGLEISACHGVNDFEKTAPQPFVFDADIYCDFLSAAKSDDIADTVNYSAASKIIAAVTTENCFDLIEKLAYECAYALLDKTSAKRVSLTVYKPKAPMKLKFGTVGVSVDIARERAYLSVGSSLGDRSAYLDAAIEKLKAFREIKVLKVSDYIETPPYGGVAENKFLNCAVEIETYFAPKQLLDAIHETETACGRVRNKRWEDRTLDIDIIFFGDRIIREQGLSVPHPDYRRRDFVLKPLKQIAPDFVCPDTGERLADILI